MIVKKFVPIEFAANNYLVYDETAKCGILIDCAGSNEAIFEFVEKHNLNLEAVFITHAHFDHCLGLKEFKGKFPSVKIYMPKDDKALYDNLSMQCDLFGAPKVESVEIDEYIDDSKVLEFCGKKIEIIATPGHSKGSLCYLIEDNLFSGDTLFYEEIGRCDLPTGSFKEIENSIKNKLFNLEENIKVFPGHGDNTSIEHEKKFNAYFGINSIYS